jgi:CubicO group peptidase (beta-lactamase class C family)
MYKPGHDLHTTQRTWSVAKSLAGTLIGHAALRGLLRPEEPANLTAWRAPGDPRAAITIEQLMRMSSGLTSDTAGNRTDDIYMGGTAVGDRAPRWPLLHPPGTSFRYANNDILLATMALTERLPAPVRLGFPLEFFRRIGMTRTFAETDWQGDFIMSSQVWTSARDLARLGLLYLNDGVWQGERLLPEGWRAFVTHPSGPQPEGEFGYGATFWLMNHSDGVPADAFAAFGNRGQYLVIIPSRELVIVRRGYDTAEERFDVAAFTREVVAALD